MIALNSINFSIFYPIMEFKLKLKNAIKCYFFFNSINKLADRLDTESSMQKKLLFLVRSNQSYIIQIILIFYTAAYVSSNFDMKYYNLHPNL